MEIESHNLAASVNDALSFASLGSEAKTGFEEENFAHIWSVTSSRDVVLLLLWQLDWMQVRICNRSWYVLAET